MSVNELYSISERLDQLIFEAEGFNKPAHLILRELADFADSLRDDADVLAKAIAESVSETDLWYDTSKELA